MGSVEPLPRASSGFGQDSAVPLMPREARRGMGQGVW